MTCLLRLLSGLACAILLSTGAAEARSSGFPAKEAQSGKPTLVGSLWNCRTMSYPAVDGQADHGKITRRETTQNRCGNPKQPTVEMYYTSDPSFKGTDGVVLYNGGQRIDRDIHVK
ncbi:hypothetical protein EYW49_21215 [Siculibacillus lacustris]|uniref:Uncharacterized protein n=1 Tax=Siculibacillus lacustris TaxID=1549641 RepID=A0A4Q9VFX8_9HYPH|nr:hypothetical protein [Siculibacillus lacustris]TBW32915.1 hypothetical protein EYW49_21215 [Siculibacillus lacustris]